MASTSSPSSTKVNDFLTSLSLLSQKRISEDDQRQRQLQRNLDELRKLLSSRSPNRPTNPLPPTTATANDPMADIPLIKFNRNAPPKPKRPTDLYSEANPPPKPSRPLESDENAPPMPRRPLDENDRAPPPKPTRPSAFNDHNPPPKPRRPDGLPKPEPFDFKVNLVMPTASSTTSRNSSNNNKIDFRSNLKNPAVYNLNFPSKQFQSFREMEKNIQAGERSLDFDDEFELTSASSPSHKKKDWFESAITNSKTTHNSHQSAISHQDVATKIQAGKNPMSFLDSAVRKSPEGKKQVNNIGNFVPVNRRPLVDKFQDVATEAESEGGVVGGLHNSHGKLIPTKPKKPERPDKPKSFKDTKAEDTNEILEQIGKLRKSPIKSSTKPSASTTSADRAEFLDKFAVFKKPTDPVLPTKLAPTQSDYKKQDNQLLVAKLQQMLETSKLKVAPPKPNKPLLSYQEKDSELIQNQLKSLGKKRDIKSSNPSSITSNFDKSKPPATESINALQKLKKVEPLKKPKPEVEKQGQLNRSAMNSSSSLLSQVSNESSLSIQDKLNTLMKVTTAPMGLQRFTSSNEGPPGPGRLSRPATFSGSSQRESRKDTKEGELLHATKTRAKGPKRKLPKAVNASGKLLNASGVAKSGSSFSAQNSTKIDELQSRDETREEEEEPEQNIDQFTKVSSTTTEIPQLVVKKNKPPKPTLMKPTRVISGEVFL